eukprot:1160722-Pelagomonas_calceolata.AAC.12
MPTRAEGGLRSLPGGPSLPSLSQKWYAHIAFTRSVLYAFIRARLPQSCAWPVPVLHLKPDANRLPACLARQ